MNFSTSRYKRTAAWNADGRVVSGQGLQGRRELLRAARQQASRQRKCKHKEPASLLAVFIADDGAQLITFDK
jgi:hypothetical protein